MFSVADMPGFRQLGVLALLAAAPLALLAMLGLRLMRRGGARFWAAPGAVALVLLPVVLGAGLAALGMRETLESTVLVGAGGVAALGAGAAEALLPLLAGLVIATVLALAGLLLTSLGSSRDEVGPAGGFGLPAAALVAVLLSGGLVVRLVRLVKAVNGLSGVDDSVQMQLNLDLVGSGTVLLLLFALLLATALGAPRSAAPLGVKLASLLGFCLCGVLAPLGGWVIYGEVQTLTRTALTGKSDEDWPAPARVAVGDVASPAATSGAGADGLRVGGTIREPRKLKNVPPVYPDVAKQARVQGTVILECAISPEGKVTRVTVLRGIPLLDQAAVDAVKQWVYAPTLLNGEPVAVIMTVTIDFRLS
jgi:TonB family protein